MTRTILLVCKRMHACDRVLIIEILVPDLKGLMRSGSLIFYDLLVVCAQVIVGTFMLDNKKGGSGKGDASGSKLPSPVGASVPSFGFRSPVESSLMNPARANDDHPTIGGNPFTMQPTSMHLTPTRPMDWMSGPDVRTSGYDFTGISTPPPSPTSSNPQTRPTDMRCFFFFRKNRSWRTPISGKRGLRVNSRLQIG